MNDTSIALTIFQNNLNYIGKCLFCCPVAGSILFDTNNFRVLLDSFPLCLGHILISTKEHYGSAGEIPSELFSEFIKLKKEINNWAKFKTGFSIFYEHGRAGSCASVNSESSQCNHFHLHCLPINTCIHDKLLLRGYAHMNMHSYEQVQDFFYQYGNYLFFQNNDDKMFFYVVSDQIVKPHLLRTLIGQSIGKADLADWQQYDKSDLYIKSYEFTKELR